MASQNTPPPRHFWRQQTLSTSLLDQNKPLPRYSYHGRGLRRVCLEGWALIGQWMKG